MAESASKSSPVRRRPTRMQGRGLEILGHAIEYLIDSYVFNPVANDGKDEMEAAQILMKVNLAIFHECEEIIPVNQRLRRLVTQFVQRPFLTTAQHAKLKK